jgi:hypothetical protein
VRRLLVLLFATLTACESVPQLNFPQGPDGSADDGSRDDGPNGTDGATADGGTGCPNPGGNTTMCCGPIPCVGTDCGKGNNCAKCQACVPGVDVCCARSAGSADCKRLEDGC